jgi:oligoribonuclease (3'-5' exoribonuclease)
MNEENEKEMLTDKVRDSIVQRAERLIHYNELLIKQCDSWLSAEEGNRNMMKRIEERRRAEKRAKRKLFRKDVIQFVRKVFKLKAKN